jgi:predicted secreted hydrolase
MDVLEDLEDLIDELAEAAAPPPPITPPIDPDAHETRHDHTVEWWYFAGELVDSYGHTHGFEYTVTSLGTIRPFYQAYVSFVDPDHPTHPYIGYVHDSIDAYSEEDGRFSFVFPPQLGDQETWSCRGIPGDRYHLRAGFRHRDSVRVKRGLNLTLERPNYRGPLLHGNQGVVDFLGTTMGFYSRTRLSASGGIKIDDRYLEIVDGSVWMDHQWGNIQLLNRRWKYAAIHLDDERDFVYYEVINDSNGDQMQAAYLVQPYNAQLPVADAACGERRLWRGLPIENELEFTLDEGVTTLVQRPHLDNQLRIARNRASIILWEGYSTVENEAGERKGSAFLELGGNWRRALPQSDWRQLLDIRTLAGRQIYGASRAAVARRGAIPE